MLKHDVKSMMFMVTFILDEEKSLTQDNKDFLYFMGDKLCIDGAWSERQENNIIELYEGVTYA